MKALLAPIALSIALAACSYGAATTSVHSIDKENVSIVYLDDIATDRDARRMAEAYCGKSNYTLQTRDTFPDPSIMNMTYVSFNCNNGRNVTG